MSAGVQALLEERTRPAVVGAARRRAGGRLGQRGASWPGARTQHHMHGLSARQRVKYLIARLRAAASGRSRPSGRARPRRWARRPPPPGRNVRAEQRRLFASRARNPPRPGAHVRKRSPTTTHPGGSTPRVGGARRLSWPAGVQPLVVQVDHDLREPRLFARLQLRGERPEKSYFIASSEASVNARPAQRELASTTLAPNSYVALGSLMAGCPARRAKPSPSTRVAQEELLVQLLVEVEPPPSKWSAFSDIRSPAAAPRRNGR